MIKIINFDNIADLKIFSDKIIQQIAELDNELILEAEHFNINSPIRYSAYFIKEFEHRKYLSFLIAIEKNFRIVNTDIYKNIKIVCSICENEYSICGDTYKYNIENDYIDYNKINEETERLYNETIRTYNKYLSGEYKICFFD